MEKFVRYASIALLLVTAINAVIAGSLFMIDPSGGKMGLPVDYLKHSPFGSYFVPGIILFIVNGLLNFAAALAVFKNRNHSPYLVICQGIILGGWILVQVLMVRDLNALHLVMFATALLLIICGIFLLRKRAAIQRTIG